MRCAETRAQLVDLLYDELAPEQRQSLEGHLRSCAGCSAELASLEGTLQLTRAALRGPLDHRAPPAVLAAVRAAAEQAAAEQRTTPASPSLMDRLLRAARRPWLIPVLAAAAALTLVLSKRIASRSEWPQVVEERRVAASSERATETSDAPSVWGRDAVSDSNAAPTLNDEAAKRSSAAPRSHDEPAKRSNPAPTSSVNAEMGASASAQRGDSYARARRAAGGRQQRVDTLASRAQRAERPMRQAEPPAWEAAPASALAGPEVAPAAPSAAMKRSYAVSPRAAPSQASALADQERAGSRLAAQPVQDRVLTLRIERAESAFRSKRYADAAKEYRRLLRDYPTHRDAAAWRQRLHSAEAALR